MKLFLKEMEKNITNEKKKKGENKKKIKEKEKSWTMAGEFFFGTIFDFPMPINHG